MSLTSLRDGVLQSKKIELAKCVATRKRKLSELFAVTIAYPNAPLRPLSPVTESTFLELNDIERGRLFNEATLPPRSQNATLAPGAVPKVSPPHTPKATTPSRSLDGDGQVLEAPAITPLVPAQESAPSNPSLLDPASEDMGGRHQVSNGSQTTLITIEPPHMSRKASPAAQKTPLTPLPPEGPEHVGDDYHKGTNSLSVSALAAAARLESPPGSPGVDPKEAVPMLEDMGITAKLDVPDSDATISGTSQEAATNAVDATCEPQPSEKQSKVELSWREQINQDAGVQVQGPLGDESSPSSTAGPHSTNTSQINVPSPATTTEEAPTPTDTQRSGRKRSAPTQFGRDEDSPPNMLHSTSAFKRRKTSHSDVHTPDAQLRLEDQLAREEYVRDPPSVSVPDQGNAQDAQEQAKYQKSPVDLQASQSRNDAIAAVEVQNAPQDALNSSSFEAVQGVIPVSESDEIKPDQASQADLKMTESTNALDAHTTTVKEKENEMPTRATPSPIELPAQANKSSNQSDLHVSGSSPSNVPPRSPVAPRTVSQFTKAEVNHVGKPSTIGFARSSPQSRNVVRWSDEDYQALRGCTQKPPQDYCRTLYSYEAYQKLRATSLHDLVANRVKIVSTADHLTALNEEQDCRILKRIKELQEAKCWAFLQMPRCPEPAAPLTHLDHLLAEARWMALDFRMERKWKLVVAKAQAQACADWVLATPEERASMRVKTKPVRHLGADNQVQDQEIEASAEAKKSSPTPDLVASTDTDSASPESADHEVKLPMLDMLQPTAIFASQDQFSFPLKSGTVSHKMLDEIPLYNPYVVNTANHYTSTPIVPVSKYVVGKIVAAPVGPPRKRSRYDFEDDEDSHLAKRIRLDHTSSSAEDVARQAVLPPERDDVALFDPANLHQRQRIWAAHSFRPPPAQEYIMPSQKFYEARWPSQWTQEDDDKLRDLVREYSYNWLLISSYMAPKTLFPPATERRTPWECFERWVRLEGLPPDMAKHSYFKTWLTRIEAAKRANAARLQAAEQQQGGPNQAPIQSMAGRVRPDGSTESFKVVKKRNTRHINFLNFFKRIAQKDETLKYKKEEARKAALARKAQEVPVQRPNVMTPQQWSQMKHEREVRVMEKQQAWREQLLAQHRQAAMMQRSAQQSAQSSLPNGVGQQQRHGGSMLPNGQGSMPNGHLQQGPNPQARAHNMPPPMQVNHSNGGLPMNAAAPNGVPQAQMQPNMRGGGQGFPSQMTPENMRMMQVRQSQVQRAYQSQQQFTNQQHIGQSAQGLMQPPANPHGGMYNPAQFAAMQAAANGNGISTPPANGGPRPSGSSGSPRAGQAYPLQNGHPQPLSSGHVPAISHISHQIQAQQPHLSPDQVKHLSGEQLKQKLSDQQRQNALNAAAGNFAAKTAYLSNGIDPTRSDAAQQLQREAQYRQQMQQQMMRQQQQRMQSQPGNNAFPGPRPPSRSATPQYPEHQRTNSGQSAQPHGTPPQQRPGGSMNQSQSPRPPQGQIQ